MHYQMQLPEFAPSVLQTILCESTALTTYVCTETSFLVQSFLTYPRRLLFGQLDPGKTVFIILKDRSTLGPSGHVLTHQMLLKM